VKCLRTDNGDEFRARELIEFCDSKGTRLERSTPYTPQQNGVAERKNRTLVEYALAMMQTADCNPRLWAEAVHTAGCVFNRTLNSATGGKTPFELWYGVKPDLSDVRVFGCKAYVQVPRALRKKLAAKAKEAIFCGYPPGVKGWKFVDPETSLVYHSREARFIEDEFLGRDALPNLTIKPTKSLFYVLEEDDDDCGDNGSVLAPGELDAVPPGRPDAAVLPPGATPPPDVLPQRQAAAVLPPGAVPVVRLPPPAAVQQGAAEPFAPVAAHGLEEPVAAAAPDVATTFDETFQHQVDQLQPKRQRKKTAFYQAHVAQCVDAEIRKPYTIKEAWEGPQGELWRTATDAEVASLQRTQTFDVVDLPPGAKAIGTKSVFALKRDELGKVFVFTTCAKRWPRARLMCSSARRLRSLPICSRSLWRNRVSRNFAPRLVS
jgi:hypothetical protein